MYPFFKFQLTTYNPDGSILYQGADEPKNWQEIGISLKRSKEFHGVDREPSFSRLEFYENGYNALVNVYQITGVNSNATLQVWQLDGEDIAYNDLGTFALSFSSFKRKVSQGEGFYCEIDLTENLNKSKLRERRSQKHAFLNNESVEGVELPAKEYGKIDLQARDLRLSANYLMDDYTQTTSDFNTIYFPFFLTEETPIIEAQTVNLPDGGSTQDTSFYYLSSRDSTVSVNMRVKFAVLDLKASDSVIVPPIVDDFDRVFIELVRVSQTGLELEVIEIDVDYEVVQVILTNPTQNTRWIDYYIVDSINQLSINIEQGDSLQLRIRNTLVGIESLSINTTLNLDGVEYDLNGSILNIQAIADFEDSEDVNAVLSFEFANSLLEQILDKPKPLASNILGRTDIGYTQDGELSLIAYSNGMMIRNATKEDGSQPDLVASFLDFFRSLDRIRPIALFFDGDNIHIESRSEAYQLSSIVEIDVAKIEEVDIGEYYTKIKAGCKAQEYEDVDGLFEPNSEREYALPARVKEKTLDLLNPFQTDTTGIELARRLQFFENTNDTKYDSKIFMIECERSGDRIRNKIGFSDGVSEITGVNSPETLGNLSFSPKRCVINSYAKNSLFIIGGSATVTNSENISNLATRFENENLVVENLDIQEEEFNTPPFIPEKIKISGTISQNATEQISMNPNSRIQFQFDGQTYFAYAEDLSIVSGSVEGSLVRAR